MTEQSHTSNQPRQPEQTDPSLQLPKQPWHKPSVIFVSLLTTAFGPISISDATSALAFPASSRSKYFGVVPRTLMVCSSLKSPRRRGHPLGKELQATLRIPHLRAEDVLEPANSRCNCA